MGIQVFLLLPIDNLVLLHCIMTKKFNQNVEYNYCIQCMMVSMVSVP